MQVPFLDLKANYLPLKEQILREIEEVLDNTAYILGPKVKSFEERFAAAHDVSHCLAVSSGTDGNHLALWALGVGHGDEVIIPANTFIATAWGATLCGATPVFVDCEADSYNIDPSKAEEKITSKTKAIVAVHLYGQPADLDSLREIAKRHNIALVEDAAQAHLAEYKGNKIGGLGDICSFSFYPGKNLGAYGEGGAVTTNSDELNEKVKRYREHGSVKKYYHEVLGHNYRMEALQGAVLGVKMNHIAEWTEKRRAIAEKYRQLLGDISEITLPAEMPYAKHVYHLYVIQTEKRDELQSFLNENGVATGLHYPLPLHMQECFKNLGYKEGDFPVTEKLASHCLSLPMFPEMTEEQIQYVANTIKKFFVQNTSLKEYNSVAAV
ncbi:MAG TPA: DegT/DnrJ/EryC1/StrS family aminotransferase [Patescibacteria group bacterium]|nr:DegT/DnrJ/EryC1/StrS family aminotransferase [Patescibacteria group bacterium]